MYRNSEGYADPTAGSALANVQREERKKERESRQRIAAVSIRPKVYIVSRYAGDVERNTQDAIRFCRFAVRQGFIPFASHLLYPQMLRDDLPKEREAGLAFGLAFLAVCDEVWCFGTEKSPGMVQEIKEAGRLGIFIRYFDLNCEEV